MWLPNRIFRAFHQQCLQKIARIESFLNKHALTQENVTQDQLDELDNQTENLSHTRRRMASEWARHLAEIQEWGLQKGQKEPSEELLQIIKEKSMWIQLPEKGQPY